MILKTFLRVFRKAELRVKFSLAIISFFLVLSFISYLSLLLFWVNLWGNLLMLSVLVMLLSLLLVFHYEKTAKMPSKKDVSWISWLQLEWLYQKYFAINLVLSFYLFTAISFQFFNQGYSLWIPTFQAIISIITLPFILSIIFKILKRDEFDEIKVYRSRIGRMCFAYLAERMANINRMEETIRYMKYVLEMLDKQCRESGFQVDSLRKIMFLLEILCSKEVSYSDKYSGRLKELASILANFQTIDEYIPYFKSFLNDLEWFEDVIRISPKQWLFPVWKVVEGSAIGSIMTAILFIFSNEVRDFFLIIIIPILLSREFLWWVLPAIVSLVLFYCFGRSISRYRITLSDLKTLVECLDKK